MISLIDKRRCYFFLFPADFADCRRFYLLNGTRQIPLCETLRFFVFFVE